MVWYCFAVRVVPPRSPLAFLGGELGETGAPNLRCDAFRAVDAVHPDALYVANVVHLVVIIIIIKRLPWVGVLGECPFVSQRGHCVSPCLPVLCDGPQVAL
jgi:hypothetical protein